MLKIASVLPTLLMATSALAGVPNWTMSESSGPVTVASSGMVRVAGRGATLSAGDVITTGAKGRVVIVRGQEYLVVAPNTRIRVADPTQRGGMTQIVEQIGNVVYKIRKMATPHFAVETPFLAAVVKGTTFSVTVTENGASVQVIEGRVEVETRDGGARYLVLPGDIGSVSGKSLGRLNIQGRETRTIVSPNEGGGATLPTAKLLKADPVTIADAPADAVIAVAVSEPPVRLGPVTDGMVAGALIAMVNTGSDRTFASAGATAPVEAPLVPVETASGGNSASSGSDSGNANNGNAGGNSGNADSASSSSDSANAANNDGGKGSDGKSGSADGGKGNGGKSGGDDGSGGNNGKSGSDDGDKGKSGGDDGKANNGNGANGTPGGNNGNGVNGTGDGNNGNSGSGNKGNGGGNGDKGNGRSK